MEFLYRPDKSWELRFEGGTLLSERPGKPVLYAGVGAETVQMNRGNFKIEDYLTQRLPLPLSRAEVQEGGAVLEFGSRVKARLGIKGSAACLEWELLDPTLNRFWFRLDALPEEKCYGCGEQMSYFNLRGRTFPLWSSEPGVGRDKTTHLTWLCDTQNGGAGGDYYNTNYPEPTFVSSRHYFLHADCTAYADFNFKNAAFHELEFWALPASLRLESAPTFPALLQKLTALLGRQPELPDWVYNGLIMGVQGGSERAFGLMEKTLAAGIPVAGVWCQDWCGKRVTSFGKRLQWDWHYHKEMYPELPARIARLHERGIRFLAYINPYLVRDGELYREGREKGYFATHADGSEYLVDFGEFYCGVVDLTNPEAFEWFKNIIVRYQIKIGVDGWMADFGEYLPTDDIKLANDVSPMVEHNRWPVRWAQCNYEALRDTGTLGEIVYFMRAGGTGSQKYCTLLWAGDQSVDFTRHDGLATVICAALSAGMCGCGLSHSDIGGYTSLFGNCRTKEVFLRWSEMAAFTPVMRTHEGNRPEENFQYYDDADCMARLAKLVKLYRALAPYTKTLVKENSEKGLPVQRPLFVQYESDPESYDQQFEYLYGSDLLVAPVWQGEKTEWQLYLPSDEWVHLWSGRAYGRGQVTVPAPLGQIPVFYRSNSPWAELFRSAAREYLES